MVDEDFNAKFEASARPFFRREIFEAVLKNPQIVPVASDDIDHSQHCNVGEELRAVLIMNNEARKEKFARLFAGVLRQEWCLHLTACEELIDAEKDIWGYRFAFRNSPPEHALAAVPFDAFWAGLGQHRNSV